MGTSHAASSPNTVKWPAVTGSLRNTQRSATTVLNATLMATLPLLPPGYATIPAVYSAYQCLAFASSVQKEGLESTVKKGAIQLSANFVVPSISNGLWNIVSSKLETELLNTPFGKLAEVAFKKTINTILTSGLSAQEEVPTRLGPEENLRQFNEKFGQDGFLNIYFTKYLYEITEYYLHSKGKKGQDNAGLLYYQPSDHKVFSPDEIDIFRKNLRLECKQKSISLVRRIRELGLVDRLQRDSATTPRIARQIADELDEILKNLAKEAFE